MGEPKRIQLRRTKGWRKPEGCIIVARPSKWGNPFKVGEFAEHWHRSGGWPHDFYVDHHKIIRVEQAVSLYRRIIVESDEHHYHGFTAPTIEQIRNHLAGHDLACWCPLDQPCHADVLLELANAPVALSGDPK